MFWWRERTMFNVRRGTSPGSFASLQSPRVETWYNAPEADRPGSYACRLRQSSRMSNAYSKTQPLCRKRLSASRRSTLIPGLSEILRILRDLPCALLAGSRWSCFLLHPEKSSKQPASLSSTSSPHSFVLHPQAQKIFVFHFLHIGKLCL